MKLTKFLLAISVVMACSCSNNKGLDYPQFSSFTVCFDAAGGSPQPEPQTVKRGHFAALPQMEPVKEPADFVGWFTTGGTLFKFDKYPITDNITLHARYSTGPAQFIFINDYDYKYLQQRINTYFGPAEGRDIAVGQSILFYIFERDMNTFVERVRQHMAYAEQYNVPLLFELDPITFWNNVPELWNWFDPEIAGYDDKNRENVEWYGWSSEYAVKIGWLNWGSQTRLKPMANLFSPAYQDAVKDRMSTFMELISDWYFSLPKDKRWLLAGIKITGELGLGVNNWYYPNGNDYYDQPASNDPKGGISTWMKPSRGVQTIGYAAAKYSGIKTSGELTGDDIAEIERRFTVFISEIATKYNLPRKLLFAHAGGTGNDLDACMNQMVCPSWSFYGQHAIDGRNATYMMDLVQKSDAPYWGAAEWSISSSNADTWKSSLNNMLTIDKCRFVSIFTNVIANNNGVAVNQPAVDGILKVINHE